MILLIKPGIVHSGDVIECGYEVIGRTWPMEGQFLLGSSREGPCVMRSSILFKEIRNLTFVNGAPPSPFKYPSKRCRRLGLIPGLGRSPGRGNGNPLQYSFLENPMDRRAWQATVRGVTKSQTQLSNWAQSFFGTVLATKKSLAPSLQPLVYYLSLPFGFLLHQVTCLESALLTTVSGFNKWKNKNRRWTRPPSRAPGSESIHWQGDGILSLPASFSTACWKGHRFPLNPTLRRPPQASLSSALKSSQWPEQVLAGGPLWHHRDPALPGPCLQVQEHSPLRATSCPISAHHAVSEMVLVLASVFLLWLCLYVFFSER